MNKEEKKIVEHLKKTSKDRTIIPLDDEILIAVNLIEKLQKENEKLKEENEYNKLLLDMNNNFTIDKKNGNYKWNVIEIQKIKDKMEQLNKEIKSCDEINAIFKIKQQQILQELLESE